MKILVTGAGGQLGAGIVHELGPFHSLTPLTRGELDVTDHRAVTAAVSDFQPDVIINCAAYTDVDGAELHPVEALETNAFALRTLARAAAGQDAVLVHYGTDFVFDGRAEHPYRETDRPNPRSSYAASKLLGEWFAADVPRHYILRVESLFGGPSVGQAGRMSSIDRIVNAMLEGREARAFVDRTVSPSYVIDVAAATRALIEREAPPGIYHCVNSGQATWYELAAAARKLLGRDAPLAGISVNDVKLVAERPKYAALSNARLAQVGIAMPSWRDALARYIASRLDAPR